MENVIVGFISQIDKLKLHISLLVLITDGMSVIHQTSTGKTADRIMAHPINEARSGNCIVCMAPVEAPRMGIEPKYYAVSEHCKTIVCDQKIQISLRDIKNDWSC